MPAETQTDNTIITTTQEPPYSDPNKLVQYIYDTQSDRVYRYFHMKIENQTTAEDLTSQTFLKIVEKVHTYNPKKSAIITWVLTIAKNTLIDYLRSRNYKKQTRHIDLDEDFEANLPDKNSNNSPENSVKQYRNKQILDQVISELKDDEQQIIFLRYTEELSYNEIATQLGISIDAVGVKLFRVQKKIESKLIKKHLVEKLEI